MNIPHVPLIHMTREDANAILSAWKVGAAIYPEHLIRVALYVTGDLSSLR